MSEAFSAASHPIGPDERPQAQHRRGRPARRTDLRGADRTDEPGGRRAAPSGTPRGTGIQRCHVVHSPRISHSYSELFVVSTREDTWSAQRIRTPMWKAWKEVSA
jgi:hypothetical protein